MVGQLTLTASKPPKEFNTILEWSDVVRKGKLAVRANADNDEDARKARELGAEGIGLCRTEHMFLASDRLPIVRRMILASTPDEESAAFEELRKVQKKDFAAILKEMSGLPVTVRLLDPPLHEFLPRVDELEIEKATKGLSPEDENLLRAAHEWAEVNPMLGTRGVRLGVVKPGLYAMQVRALMEAADEVSSKGYEPIVEIMIPLTVTREELALARSWVEEVLADINSRPVPKAKKGQKVVKRPKISIGTMIETPRAALRADELAEFADFFSFGTNDLTQMTFGFSRDDVESRLMPAYLEAGLLKRNPFETIDQSGVGELVFLAAQRGRKVKRSLKLGVCGEHGGDPESIDMFYRAGLNYVSCSPYRVPIARLSAAQAVIGTAKTETK
jgi:pyruvate,orthophosphate dikinase